MRSVNTNSILLRKSWLLSLSLLILTAAVRGQGLDLSANGDAVQAREDRVALVIGNTEYPRVRLKNPINDATDLRDQLETVGFKVTLRKDMTLKDMRQVVTQFVSDIRENTVAVFYFAGHGIQLNQENYLIPVDFSASEPSDVGASAFPASRIQDLMADKRGALNIIIFDACRDNPYRARVDRAVVVPAKGLAPMNPIGAGIVIVFATSPGRTASENWNGRNGLFTGELLNAMKEKACLDEILNLTQTRVAKLSGLAQIPEIRSIKSGEFCFRARPAEPISLPTSPDPKPGRQDPPPCDGKKIPNERSFSVDSNTQPIGIMGDINDIRISKREGLTQFTYTTTGKGHHEWEHKYKGTELNSEPAQFAGVMYLDPDSHFGTSCGGYDLTGMRVVKWKARSVGQEATVEFQIGGVKWMWGPEKGAKVDPPYPDSLPTIKLGQPRKLPKDEWQEFQFRLPNYPDAYFKRVINAFSWVLTWGSNDVTLNNDRTGSVVPEKFVIEIKDISYERE